MVPKVALLPTLLYTFCYLATTYVRASSSKVDIPDKKTSLCHLFQFKLRRASASEQAAIGKYSMASTEPPETTQHEDSMAANGPDRIREQEQFTLLSQKINDQADALPSPAMDIFSRHLRTVRITQLAPEPLSDIFGYFQHPALHENRINMDCINARFPRDHFQALKSLRLTCSLFNQIATPLLLPNLRVQVGKPSLDRIQAIAKNSLLSAGLRGIQVHMGYRFKTLALDETEFFSYQRGHVNQLLNYHAMFLKHWIDKATGDGTGQALLWSDERFTMLERIRACVLACDRYLGREALSTPRISSLPYDALPELLKEPVNDELVAEYQKVLYQAHQDYRVGGSNSTLYLQTKTKLLDG
ncbi:unnamed protein product [Clonostachys solani]|uniref:F-box domain-containing protein n=1 Tax=Clonostachys solani TaxID=160281 RepID=A0A9N9VVT1_9HYPO|nr:unnamed protein product [Clonostachys solani]